MCIRDRTDTHTHAHTQRHKHTTHTDTHLPSRAPETSSCWLPGRKLTALTLPVCPRSVADSSGPSSSMLHTRIVWSPDAVASSRSPSAAPRTARGQRGQCEGGETRAGRRRGKGHGQREAERRPSVALRPCCQVPLLAQSMRGSRGCKRGQGREGSEEGGGREAPEKAWSKMALRWHIHLWTFDSRASFATLVLMRDT